MSSGTLTDPVAPLPRGRHAAPRAVVARSQRERLLEAMAEAVAVNGYAATSVADVLAGAGVSRKTFYEHFANKQECFLHAYDDGVDRVLAHIEGALARESEVVGLAAAGVNAYLGWMAAHPAFARTFILEALAAGPHALERRAAVHERFAAHFSQVYAAAQDLLPELEELPAYRFRACVGATDELVLEHVRVHGPATLETLSEAMFEVIVNLLGVTALANPPAR